MAETTIHLYKIFDDFDHNQERSSSGDFGERIHEFPRLPYHRGVDFGGNYIVRAAHQGKVIRIISPEKEYEDNIPGIIDWDLPPEGNFIVLEDEKQKIRTYYYHLKKGTIKVALHQIIEVGQELAIMGNTGASTDYHLHFALELITDTSPWLPVTDPELLAKLGDKHKYGCYIDPLGKVVPPGYKVVWHDNKGYWTSVASPLQEKDALNEEPPLWWYHRSEAADGGFYPVGLNRCVHGGVHICSLDSRPLPVRALAPGYVVAFRFFSGKRELEIQEDQAAALSDTMEMMFSDPSWSGFVLIRHEIKDKDGKDIPPFYSLYMNLAPFRKSAITGDSNTHWYKLLINMIRGGIVDFSYEHLGAFKWKELDNDDEISNFRTRKSDHQLYSLTYSEMKSGNVEYVLVHKSDDETLEKVITFSEPYFYVQGGDIIGYTEKLNLSKEKTNFVHWEVFAPDAGTQGNSFTSLAEYFGNGFSFNEITENDNFLTKSELDELFEADNLELLDFMKYTFFRSTVNYDEMPSTDIFTAINPFFSTMIDKIKNNEYIGYSEAFPLIYSFSSTYDIQLTISLPEHYSIRNVTVELSCSIGNYSGSGLKYLLAAEKSGSSIKFTIPTRGNPDPGNSTSIICGIKDLDGCTITVPSLVEKIKIKGTDSSFSDIIIHISGEKDLFLAEVEDNFRNILVKHPFDWTSGAMKSLTDSLLENSVIPESYDGNYSDEHFKEIIWCDRDKEHPVNDALFFNDDYLPDPDSNNYAHIHPVTCAWLLRLLKNEDTINFPQDNHPEESIDNPITRFASYLQNNDYGKVPPNLGQDTIDTVPGNTMKIIFVGEEIRRIKSDQEVELPVNSNIKRKIETDEYGIALLTIPLHYWGDYTITIDQGVKIEGTKDVRVNKPSFISMGIQENRGMIDLSTSQSIVRKLYLSAGLSGIPPIFLPGLLCFCYSKHSNTTDPEEWTDLSRGLIIGGVTEQISDCLTFDYNPLDIYKIILTEIGSLEQNEVISIKVLFVSPNGGIETMNKEFDPPLEKSTYLSGSMVMDKKQEWIDDDESCFYPADKEYESIDDRILLPVFSGVSERYFFPENDNKQFIVECGAFFAADNDAYKYIPVEDYTITAKAGDNTASIITRRYYYDPDTETYQLRAGIHLPEGLFNGNNATTTISFIFKYSLKNITGKKEDAENYITESSVESSFQKPAISTVDSEYNPGTKTMNIKLTTVNVPTWGQYMGTIEWEENNISWKNYIDGIVYNTTINAFDLSIPEDRIAGRNCTQITLSAVSIKNNNLENIKKEETFSILIPQTHVMKICPVIESGGFTTVGLRSEANNKSEQLITISNGEKVRVYTDETGQVLIVNGLKNGQPKQYYKVEYCKDKKTYMGYLFTTRVDVGGE